MWNYETSLDWKSGKNGEANCEGKPAIEVTTPPEFGGPENIWTPEDLLNSAIESCIMASALFFLNLGKIGFRSYKSEATSTMKKEAGGLGFSQITVKVTLELDDPTQADSARKAMEQAKKNCPISNALKCPVGLVIQVG